jgi:hypothetical protein
MNMRSTLLSTSAFNFNLRRYTKVGNYLALVHFGRRGSTLRAARVPLSLARGEGEDDAASGGGTRDADWAALSEPISAALLTPPRLGAAASGRDELTVVGRCRLTLSNPY